jgi:hypothetical protein
MKTCDPFVTRAPMVPAVIDGWPKPNGGIAEGDEHSRHLHVDGDVIEPAGDVSRRVVDDENLDRRVPAGAQANGGAHHARNGVQPEHVAVLRRDGGAHVLGALLGGSGELVTRWSGDGRVGAGSEQVGAQDGRDGRDAPGMERHDASLTGTLARSSASDALIMQTRDGAARGRLRVGASQIGCSELADICWRVREGPAREPVNR